uniref:Reverse transcriptase zinc-binding domain-containing protein n=1 Tax=Cajanus cajan TaxID=3821 RepID=A0A151QSJ1_CAJCA|nr:hypothetical protein KK1_045883 [Cajanus cajan]
MYSVSSAYRTIKSTQSIPGDSLFLNAVWKINIPPKVVIFCWRLHHNALATVDNLRRRNIMLEEESNMYIIWKEWYGWVASATVLPQDPVQHFLQGPYTLQSSTERKRWQVVWSAIAWNIWKQRNKCRFQRETFNLQTLQSQIQSFAWAWLRMEKSFHYSFQQWANNPGACIIY